MQFLRLNGNKNAARLFLFPLRERAYDKRGLFHFYLTETAPRLHSSYGAELRQRSADRIIKEDASMQRDEYHTRFCYHCNIESINRSFI